MTEKLASLLFLTAATLFVLAETRAQSRRRWRKWLLTILGLAWLGCASFLIWEFLLRAPLVNAIRSGDTNKVYQLLSAKPQLVHQRTILGDTPLHLAVALGDANVVRRLIHIGADVNAKGDSRVTPLHEAAFYGKSEIAELLLAAGADVNAVGYRHNNTPLHVATVHGHAGLAKVLLEHGADVNSQDTLGKTALQYAQEMKLTNMTAILSSPTRK